VTVSLLGGDPQALRADGGAHPLAHGIVYPLHFLCLEEIVLAEHGTNERSPPRVLLTLVANAEDFLSLLRGHAPRGDGNLAEEKIFFSRHAEFLSANRAGLDLLSAVDPRAGKK
jgi:hypothetical protein